MPWLLFLFLFAAPAAADQIALLDRATCLTLLQRHVPDGDVAYDAERDAEAGIVPPNLSPPNLSSGGRLRLSEDRRFPIRVLLPLSEPDRRPGLPEADLTLAMVAIEDGVVTVDGQPIGGAARLRLIDLCREQGQGATQP